MHSLYNLLRPCELCLSLTIISPFIQSHMYRGCWWLSSTRLQWRSLLSTANGTPCGSAMPPAEMPGATLWSGASLCLPSSEVSPHLLAWTKPRSWTFFLVNLPSDLTQHCKGSGFYKAAFSTVNLGTLKQPFPNTGGVADTRDTKALSSPRPSSCHALWSIEPRYWMQIWALFSHLLTPIGMNDVNVLKENFVKSVHR